MSVTQDATSLLYIPQSAAEFTTLLSGSGLSNPAHLYKMQEGTGTLADSIGSLGIPAHNTPNYGGTITGWASKAAGCSDGSTSCFETSSGPDVSSTSALLFAWVRWPASWGGGHRNLFTFGTSFTSGQLVVWSNTTGTQLSIQGGSNLTGVDSANNYTNRSGPIVLQVNRAGSICRCVTDTETLSFSSALPSGSGQTNFAIGGDNGANYNTSGAIQVMYMAMWTGAAAEMSAPNITTLINLMTNGPTATGGGRLAGSSPLSASGLVSSPLVNNTRARMPGPTRYFDCHGGI